MKLSLLLLFVIIQKSSSSCDSQCDCPDLEQLYTGSGSPFIFKYEEKAGCARSLEVTAKVIFAVLDDTDTNIPAQVDEDGDIIAHSHNISTPFSQRPNITADLFSAFGIICENSTWMITKFPRGINGLEYIPVEEANGKGYKAKFSRMLSMNHE